MDIGKALRYAREESNKTVYEVERLTNITHSNIYRWENNKTIPSILQCIILADCYKISLDDLLGREIGKKDEKINIKYYKCKF